MAAGILVMIVAALHVWFLVLEMFLWTKPKGLRTFGMEPNFAEATKALAANQGLYNGFLAGGLVWSFCINPAFRDQIRLFFLSCVLIAGVYGGITANRKILFIQALPALIALLFVACC
jgi:putative membrane protein